MSVTLLLLPLAIALGTSVTTVAVSTTATAVAMVGSKAVLAVAAESNLRHLKHLRELYEKSQNKTLPPMETIFNDMALLKKTLEEHGLTTTSLSGNQLLCQIGEVQLNYHRQTHTEPFMVTVTGLQNIDDFLSEMECFEREYRQNVQSYTYERLRENLSRTNMQVTEETVLDDNTILLTINV